MIFTNSQFFVGRHILQSKKSSSPEGYTLSNTCMVKSQFHRCSLIGKRFNVYGNIFGQQGASLNPGFAKKHDFHKFSVFIKRHILWSKKSSSPEGYTLSNTCMVKSQVRQHVPLMVKVLCVLYHSWSGGSIFEPRFCKKT